MAQSGDMPSGVALNGHVPPPSAVPSTTASVEAGEFKLGGMEPVEYFFASDASAVIEHTNKVIYLEDGDIAHVDNAGGTLMLVKKCRVFYQMIKCPINSISLNSRFSVYMVL